MTTTDEQDTHALLIENACLVLLDNPSFEVLLTELQKMRDTFEQKHIIGLDPTSNSRLVQRNLGYIAGMDALLLTPALLASGKLRKGKAAPRQQAYRPPSIGPLETT